MRVTNENGVTLIEVILVLAIGAAIVIAGIRQYQTYRLEADARQLQYNVDTIFAAMSQYYKANCYGTTDTNGNATYGRLNPLSSTPPQTPIQPINIASDLRANNFLTINYPLNPLVNNAGGGGYVAQFNFATFERQICITASPTSGPAINPFSPTCSANRQVATVLTWRPQVAVLLQNPALGPQLLAMVNGDCLSSGNGSTVTPCGGVYPGSGPYIVWERSPNFASPGSASGYEFMNPVTEQFRQMYTTYPMVYLVDSGGTMPASGTASNSPQYLYCGD